MERLPMELQKSILHKTLNLLKLEMARLDEDNDPWYSIGSSIFDKHEVIVNYLESMYHTLNDMERDAMLLTSEAIPSHINQLIANEDNAAIASLDLGNEIDYRDWWSNHPDNIWQVGDLCIGGLTYDSPVIN